MTSLSSGKLGATVKILPLDLTPIIEGIAANKGRLPVVKTISEAPQDTLFASLEHHLAARSEQAEGLFLPHTLSYFTIGEAKIELLESVVGADVVIMPTYNQAALSDNPLAAGIMRAFLFNNYVLLSQFAANVAMTAGAQRTHLFSPYSPYERSDKKHEQRSGILAKAIAKIFSVFSSVTGVHLHAQQIEGFYDNSFFNVTNNELFMLDFLRTDPNDISKKKPLHELDEAHFDALFKKVIIASPDIGGSTTVKNFAVDAKEVAAIILAQNLAAQGKPVKYYKDNLPDIDIAAVDKRRDARNQATSVYNIIFSGSLKKKRVIIMDDILDTGGTLSKAAQAFMDKGAAETAAYITHPVLSNDAVDIIANSPLKWVGVTNSFNESGLKRAQAITDKFRVFDLGPALAQIIADLSTGPRPTLIEPQRYVGGDMGAALRVKGRFLPAALAALEAK